MLGYLALVLHAHLPFIRHPEHPRFLEEHWLFEAITDCYLPLIEVLSELAERPIRPCLTLSLSPTLIAMLGDPLLRARYLDYLERRARLCEAETRRRVAQPRVAALARGYLERLVGLAALYSDRLSCDLVSAFGALAKAGVIELATTAATHGYLPLLRTHRTAVQAQLGVAQDAFEATFGHPCAGLWLPECGWYEGLEADIAAAGFHYTVVDAHGLAGAVPTPVRGVWAPIAVPAPAATVAVFGRDPDSATEVWSPHLGYPGHPVYREYHSDLGYTLERALLDDFLPPGVAAAPTGVKYHRVTGGAGPKALYEPEVAAAQAMEDAARFVARRRAALEGCEPGSAPPILVCAYDAELFGHWWHEGPGFLAGVLGGAHALGLEAVSLGVYLARHDVSQKARPAPSSWGEHGYNAAWLTRETGWIYPLLHAAAGDLTELVEAHLCNPSKALGDQTGRVLAQAARSLLLAQSSDWPFCIARGSASDYALTRLRDALARFRMLIEAARSGALDTDRLAALEAMDNLFPVLDLTRFREYRSHDMLDKQ